MRNTVEMLASAIHDAKNQLFFAENAIASIASTHGVDATAAQNAIELAAERLTNALLAYRLSRGDMQPSISPVATGNLIEDVRAIHHSHIAAQGLGFDTRCNDERIWPLDRDLIIDILNNAIQNAARYARSRIVLVLEIDQDWLVLRVEDDGPGFAERPEGDVSNSGLGLHIGQRIASLHERHGKRGHLKTYCGGTLGGAVVELRLP